MSTEKIKPTGFLQRIWMDPVFSKIISVVIIFLATILYSFIVTTFRDVSFIQVLKDTINFRIELYKIFIIAISILLLIGMYYKWRQKRKARIGKFDIEMKVGEFTFRELFNALSTHQIELPSSLKSPEYGNESDLLKLFIIFQRQLNTGIDWDYPGDQGIFLYQQLGPTLMTYGLTEKVPDRSKRHHFEMPIIQTSRIGYKFHSMVTRWRVFNDEIMKLDITKTKTRPRKEKED